MAEQLLKLADIARETTLSRSTLYLMMSKGTFPRPIKIGKRCARWTQADIETWLESRKAMRA